MEIWQTESCVQGRGGRMTEQEILELVRNSYAEANKDYLLQQIKEASINLTDEQKKQLGLRVESDIE